MTAPHDFASTVSSRYADLVPFPSLDGRDFSVAYTVFRFPPVSPTGYVKYHEWKEGDRWDLLAVNYLGNSALWSVLLDFNPEISDPLFMEPGTIVVVPAPNVEV